MWIFKFLPCALLGCKAPPGPPDLALVIDQFLLQAQAQLPPPPPVTVTVTVGVVATPVNHVYVAPAYPTATPKAVPSYPTYDGIALDNFSNTPLSFHDTIIAAAYWAQDAGFNVDFRVTPLRLAIAAFFLGWLHLAFMILFQDFKLASYAVKSLFRGFCKNSKVFWTLLFSGALYQMLKELFIEAALGLGRLVSSTLQRVCNAASTSCIKARPTVVRGSGFMVGRLGRYLVSLYHFIDEQLMQHGCTWKSPLVWICKTLPVGVFMWLRAAFALFRLRLWLGQKPLDVNLNLAYDYKRRDALEQVALMNVYDMAEVVMERNDLKVEVAEMEPKVRKEVRNEEHNFVVELGGRCIGLRTSLQCLLMDYNWLLSVLDTIVSIYINEMHGIASSSNYTRRYTRSSQRGYCENPTPNGLHYKVYPCTAPYDLSDQQKNVYADLVLKLLEQSRGGTIRTSMTRTNPFFAIPMMDLLGKSTWGLDVHFPHFVRLNGSFAKQGAHANHVDPSQRIAQPRPDNAIEDYAARGDVQQWYNDLPTRIARQRELQHSFWRLYT